MVASIDYKWSSLFGYMWSFLPRVGSGHVIFEQMVDLSIYDHFLSSKDRRSLLLS